MHGTATNLSARTSHGRPIRANNLQRLYIVSIISAVALASFVFMFGLFQRSVSKMINTSATVSKTKYRDVTIYTDDAMYLVPMSGSVVKISGITLPNMNDPNNKSLNIDVKSSSWQIKVGALVGGNHAPPGVYTLDIIVDERY